MSAPLGAAATPPANALFSLPDDDNPGNMEDGSSVTNGVDTWKRCVHSACRCSAVSLRIRSSIFSRFLAASS